MTYDMEADTSDVGRLVQRLGNSADPSNKLAGSLPQPPQSGPATELIAATLAPITQSAGALADGLGMAGTRLGQSGGGVQAAEDTNRGSMGASGPYGAGG